LRTDKSAGWAAAVDKIALLQGPTVATPPFDTAFGFPFNAKLMIVGWFDDMIFAQRLTDPYGTAAGGPTSVGVNPSFVSTGGDPEQCADALYRMRRANMGSSGSLLMALGNITSGVNGEISTVGYTTQNYRAYVRPHYEVAQTMRCGVIDHTQIWGEHPPAGYYGPTNPHPRDAGQAARANDILDVI